MNDDAQPVDDQPADEAAAREAERRRRRAEIFGDVLPESTADDREHDGDRRGGHDDEWLLRNVPPHHGG